MIRLIGLLGFVAAAQAAGIHQWGNETDDCPFGPGTCPVTKDNVIDVFFFDIEDRLSCQKHCLDIPDCHFFTQFGVAYDPPAGHAEDKTKCFLFKTCDELEPCPQCQTGKLFLRVYRPLR